jgi:hypothetical protein
MESRIGKYGIGLTALGMCGAMFTGCLFENGQQGPSQAGPNPIPSMHCGELTAAQQKTGDSLVALAKAAQSGDVQMMVSAGEWQDVGDESAHQAMAYYNQALAKAPGHCGAVFGRALTQAQMLLQDKGFNQVVSEAMKAGAGKKGAGKAAATAVPSQPVTQAFKASRDEAAPLVLRVSAGLENVDKPFISAQQELLATELLPGLDSVIASLDAVMAQPDFSVDFPREDGGVIQIDAGEVGPVLGGLKVARALLLLICGYQWEVAKDGAYDWIDRVDNLRPADFKNLTAKQRSDMDHLVGLFKVGSPFTRVKPAWKDAVQGIPALLLSAVENTQTGLRYALSEADHPEKQINDVYRVGTGESDDIDPKDLEGVIDALERTKKYLKGEVALEYHNGTHTLKLNFTRFFAWDGLQNYLPYHKVQPYETWFPGAGIAYEEFSPSSGDPAAKILSALELSRSDAVDIVSADGGYSVVLRDQDGWFTAPYEGPEVVLADLTPGSAPCTFKYVKHAGRRRSNLDIFPDEGTFVTTEDQGQGVIDMGATCKVTPDGWTYYTFSDSIPAVPFYFTDAFGRKTLEPDQVDKVVEDLGLAALTGKIVFPDPTFGGVFPGLNNDNIWSTMQSLDAVGPRLNEKCDQFGENCIRELPNNPSDLDVWARYLFWLDNLF